MEANLPLIVIVGPTASGKTSVAITLAERLNGEIICADSRTIYKHMNIGTAKPTAAEQARVPHWGLDLVEPGMRFTAADFKKYALSKIEEIRSRGRVPFLVGGSGLYIDAVLFDYQFGNPSSHDKRVDLQSQTLEQLKQYCRYNNIKLPENENNKRYIIRAIEQKGINTSRRDSPIEDSIVVGISTNKEMLRTRITQRNGQFLYNGVVEEAIMLGKRYGWNGEAMTGNIYPLVKQYIDGTLDYDEFTDRSSVRDWQLAKRQLTWFRRNKFIEWMPLENIEHYISREFARLISS